MQAQGAKKDKERRRTPGKVQAGIEKEWDHALGEFYRELRFLAGSLQEVREAERARMARAIHDEVGQRLTSLKLGIEGLQAAVGRADGTSAVLRRITALVRQTDEAIAGIRRLISELRPRTPEGGGLAAAIRDHANSFEALTGVHCQLSGLELVAALDGEQSGGVFRILQEALTNVARHAAADRVSVEFATMNGRFSMCVTDDGRGIEPDRVLDPASLGLLGMRERALMLGGRVDIANVFPHGTAVRLALLMRKRPGERGR